MYELFLSLTDLVSSFSYVGIFIMTLIEGTFIPIPTEITLIPAGYLIHKGQFNALYVFVASIAGTLCGVLISYYIAYYFGRIILIKYGKYIMLSEKKLDKIERFFEKHGPISAFTGRMLPGIKHFISFPAGLGRMNLKLFTLFSTLGATLWIITLLMLGYIIGNNEAEISKYIKKINFIFIILMAILVIFYILRFAKQRKRQ